MRFFLIFLLLPSLLWADPSWWRAEWPETDFSRSSVEWTEIKSGGPPKDGIPAIDAPQFILVSEASLEAPEAVIAVEIAGSEPRA